MLFWLACEDLKTESSAELVEEKARLIYEDYISILSPKEVCIIASYSCARIEVGIVICLLESHVQSNHIHVHERVVENQYQL